MRSEIAVFYKAGYLKNFLVAPENVLPFDKFNIFYDLKNPELDPFMGEDVVKTAESYLDLEIPMLTLSMFRDFRLTGVRSRYEAGYGKRRQMLLHFALAEAYENKGRFTDRAADLIWAILDECCWTLPAHMGHSPIVPTPTVPYPYKDDDPVALDLQTAQTASLLALAGYLLRDKLDSINPYIYERIAYRVYTRAVKPYIDVCYRWSGDLVNSGNLNNWLTNITSCVLFATALTVESFSERKRVLELAMYRLDHYTACQPEDGVCDEGPGYWGAAAGNLFDCLEIIEAMSGGRITVYDSPIIKNLGEYVADLHVDGLYYVPFADSRPRLRHDGKMIMRYGEKCHSEKLLALGRMISKNRDDQGSVHYTMCYRHMKNLFVPRYTGDAPITGDVATWYDSRKVAIFRESENKSHGFFVAIKGGNNHECHNHNDVGCFVVYYNGEPVIIDPSHGSYDNGFFGPTRYDRWFMKSSYHSIPTVDGVEEREGAEFASRDEVCDLSSRCVTMDLAGAFPPEAGVLRMQRTLQLDGDTVLLADEVRADHEADIRFNYLTLDEPEVISEGKLKITGGRVFEYDPGGFTLIIERVENTNLPYDDLNFRGSWQRDCLYRIVLLARGGEATLRASIK